MSLWRRKLTASWNVYRSGPTRNLFHDGDLPGSIADALWRDPEEHVLRKSHLLQVKDRCLVARYTDRHGEFLCKRSHWGTVWRSFRMLLRLPVALQCAAAGIFLKEHGIPTPRPRACLVQGFGPFRYRSYLLNEFVDGASLFQRIRAGDLTPGQVLSLARQLAKIWEKLISLGISHNDLKPENLIVDQAMRLWLIDLEKMRVHRNCKALRSRHLRDVERFLHVRTWRDQTGAAEIFRQELEKTSLGAWTGSEDTSKHLLCCSGYSSSDLSNRISVGIVAHRQANEDEIQRTVKSVEDLADEIAVVDPVSRHGQLLVLRRIVRRGDGTAPSVKCQVGMDITGDRHLLHPWVMLLHAGEYATPDLVRQLPERLVGDAEFDAVSILVEECVGWRGTGRVRQSEVRVVNRDRCVYALEGGVMVCETAPERIFKLGVSIKQQLASSIEEYHELVRQRQRRAASGERSRPRSQLRRVLRVVLRFGKGYLAQGRFRSGRLGLRVSWGEAGGSRTSEVADVGMASKDRSEGAATGSRRNVA